MSKVGFGHAAGARYNTVPPIVAVRQERERASLLRRMEADPRQAGIGGDSGPKETPCRAESWT